MKWRFREHRDGETAEFVAAGFTVSVQDCDGDWSWWRVRRGRDILAEGQEDGSDPYHFDAALEAAEAAFRAEVARRKAALSEDRT